MIHIRFMHLALACLFSVVPLFTEPTVERGRTLSRISVAKGSTLNFRGRKSNSLMNLCGKKRFKLKIKYSCLFFTFTFLFYLTIVLLLLHILFCDISLVNGNFLLSLGTGYSHFCLNECSVW